VNDIRDARPAPTFEVPDVDPQAGTALREVHDSAASFARFPEENPDPVLRIAAGSRLAYANPAARAALAHLQLEVGREVPPQLAAGARRATDGGARVWVEVACGTRIFSLSFTPAAGDGSVHVYGQDVTEQRWAFEQLAAQKERLRVTLGSIGDAVIATDEAARGTLLNKVAEELTGWSAEAATGRHVDEVFRIVSEETRQPAVNPVQRALREGVVVGLANHTALVARDGSERPIADSAAPIRDADGRVSGVVLVFRDQTKEREAEQALRESERRIRTKLDAILLPGGDVSTLELGDILDAGALRSMMQEFNQLTRIPMAIIDVRGKVLVGVDWQDICTKFHRVHPETCKHCVESDTTLTACVRPGEIQRYRCKNNMWDVATPIVVGGHLAGNVFMGQFFFEDEPIEYDVFRAQASRYGFDERDYLAALDAVPRLGRDTVAAGMRFFVKFAGMLSQSSYSNLKLARAAAERDALLTSLRESKERLEETDRRKNEFLAVLSHELRNPLAPIRNSIYILNRAAPDGPQAERAKAVIERQVEHITTLVDDLLDVTRIARGKIQLQRSRTDLALLVRRAAEDHAALMAQRGIEFTVEGPREPLWLHGDANRLAQVVGNLLQNAAKFTPREGTVTLSLQVVAGAAELHVRDSGVGMDVDILDRAFEAFVQADRSLARTEGGLGLGLALVKGITELHGGSVRAESAGPGQGSEFVVRLPLREAPAVEAVAAPCSTAHGREHRVLVVDDNVDGAQSLVQVVEMLGHVADVAFDGPTAIAKARLAPPHIVLCDIGLPGLSGYEVAKALRAGSDRAMQLIALTGYAQPEDVQRAIEAGFDRHVAKPVDVAELERLLGDAGAAP
jgi:PAS domain S-box-containing protein